MPLPNDKYGRTVVMNTVGPSDVYDVGSGPDFTVSFPTGTLQKTAYRAIEGNAPTTYDDPNEYIDLQLDLNFVIANNTTKTITEAEYDASDYKGAIIKFVAIQETTLYTEVGTCYVSNNTSSVTLTSQSSYINNPKISFSAAISNGKVLISVSNSDSTYDLSLRLKIEVLKP